MPGSSVRTLEKKGKKKKDKEETLVWVSVVDVRPKESGVNWTVRIMDLVPSTYVLTRSAITEA